MSSQGKLGKRVWQGMAGCTGISGVGTANRPQNLRELWEKIKYPRMGLVSTSHNSFEIKLTSGGVSADKVNVGGP